MIEPHPTIDLNFALNHTFLLAGSSLIPMEKQQTTCKTMTSKSSKEAEGKKSALLSFIVTLILSHKNSFLAYVIYM